jgi:Ser/Thr protein kinase RdoA (MazF antagonist)
MGAMSWSRSGEAVTGWGAQATSAQRMSLSQSWRGCIANSSRVVRLGIQYLAGAPVRHAEYWLRKHGLDVARLLAIAEEMRAAIWQANALESGFCHADVRLGNVRFVEASPTIFDFEGCGVGPYVYDVACYWRKHVFGSADPGQAARAWQAFLRGYGSVRPLAAAS